MRTNKKENLKLDLDFENDLEIDPLSLDEEWLNQPNIFYRYSKALAQAKKERRLAEKTLLIAQAEVRKNYNGKTTVDIMKEESAELEEWEAFKEARYREDLLEAAVRALQQRKTALENMVELLKMQYFSGPNEPRDFNKTNQTTNARIGKSLNKEKGDM